MATLIKLGPTDHGRAISHDEFLAGDYQEGYKYELIDGRLYVTHLPDPPQNIVEVWLFIQLHHYARSHPRILNYVTSKARVFVPGRRRTTTPEPDLAAYRDFPLDLPFQEIRWQDYSPILVAEVLSADDPDKDLVRNVELYLQIPAIREYWVLDTRDDPNQPSMRVYRRQGARWKIIDLAAGDTYTTRLLPGLKLVIDPRG
jgi:Uma2 family endonuclease